MNKLNKILLYHVLRSQGTRLYSMKSWTRVTFLQNNGDAMSGQAVRKIATASTAPDQISWTDKLKEKLGFQGALDYSPQVLAYSGFRLYLSASEAVQYNKIGEHIHIPDTMRSWHQLLSIHMWLMMVRLKAEGREGCIVRNHMIKSMHTDVANKSKLIGTKLQVRVKKEEQASLYEEFLASVFSYDEGLLGSDKDMAAAVWRMVFNMGEDVDPYHVEIMVHYIRKQTVHLQRFTRNDLLSNGLLPFLSFYGDKVSEDTMKLLNILKSTQFQIAG